MSNPVGILSVPPDVPDGPPEKCPWDSMGKKWWPRHHEFSSLAMQSSNDIIFENTSDFDHPPKISAPAPSQYAKKNKKKPTLSAEEKAKKKEQLLEWAKKMRIDVIGWVQTTS